MTVSSQRTMMAPPSPRLLPDCPERERPSESASEASSVGSGWPSMVMRGGLVVAATSKKRAWAIFSAMARVASPGSMAVGPTKFSAQVTPKLTTLGVPRVTLKRRRSSVVRLLPGGSVAVSSLIRWRPGRISPKWKRPSRSAST